MNRKVNASGLGQLFMDALGASPDYRGRADAYLKRRQLELETLRTNSGVEKDREATRGLHEKNKFEKERYDASRDNADKLEHAIHLGTIGPKQEQLQKNLTSQLGDNFQPIHEEDLYEDRIAAAWGDVFRPRDNAPQLTATSRQEILSPAELARKKYAESTARMQSLSGASASPSGGVEGAVAFNDALPNLLSGQASVDEGEIRKAADGYYYYVTGPKKGLRVLPDVQKEERNGIYVDPETGQLRGSSKQDETNRANAVYDNQQLSANASKIKDTIKAMRGVLENAGYTGPGGNLYDKVDTIMEGVNLPFSLPGSPGARAVLKSGSMEFILAMVQNTKGAISNKEMDLFATAAAGLLQSYEGNKILLDMAERIADRQIERTSAMEQYRQKNGTLDGFESQWAQYIEANPIVTDDLIPWGMSGKANPDEVSFTDDEDEMELKRLMNLYAD